VHWWLRGPEPQRLSVYLSNGCSATHQAWQSMNMDGQNSYWPRVSLPYVYCTAPIRQHQ